jgi:hypothetical protein
VIYLRHVGTALLAVIGVALTVAVGYWFVEEIGGVLWDNWPYFAFIGSMAILGTIAQALEGTDGEFWFGMIAFPLVLAGGIAYVVLT